MVVTEEQHRELVDRVMRLEKQVSFIAEKHSKIETKVNAIVWIAGATFITILPITIGEALKLLGLAL